VGDAPPIADPPDILRWLAWVALLALVVITARMRPVALRAWVLLGLYVVMVAGLLSATRLGAVLSGLAGLVPRYVGDIVVVGALCIGVALLGLNDRKYGQPARPPLWPAALREPGVVAVGLVAAFLAMAILAVGTLWSTARFSDAWAVKEGREYLRITQAELRAAPSGTVFIDQAVPETVLPGFFWPDNLQSSFFRPMSHQPVFVTEAEHPSVFDDKGHIRPAEVAGFKIREGSVEGCGNLVDKGNPTHMPLDGWANNWPWVAYVGYVSSGDSVATLRLGDATHRFAVHQGLHQIFFVIQGEGSAVELSVDDPDVALCTRAITIGHLVPRTS
jgi:hypothetical protein